MELNRNSQRAQSMYMHLKNAPGGATSVSIPYGYKLLDVDGYTYRLDKFAFKGGNSSVFYATKLSPDNTVNCTCAVKLLGALSEERKDRFHNEARIMKDLSHEYISKFYAFGVTDFDTLSFKIPWIAMDLGGFNLDKYVREMEFFVLIKFLKWEKRYVLHCNTYIKKGLFTEISSLQILYGIIPTRLTVLL